MFRLVSQVHRAEVSTDLRTSPKESRASAERLETSKVLFFLIAMLWVARESLK